jgi:hypothetical protein
LGFLLTLEGFERDGLGQAHSSGRTNQSETQTFLLGQMDDVLKGNISVNEQELS